MPEHRQHLPFMTHKHLYLSGEAAAWLARLQRGNLSEQDIREFEAWKQQSREHERAWADMRALWEDPAILAALQVVALSSSRTGRAPRLSLYRRPLIMGSMAVGLAVALLVIALSSRNLLLRLQADFQTALGEQRSLQLPDGSSVTMNTKTSIATEFGAARRRIRLLEGEAFFAVSPDPHKPFVVESHNVVARAIGTAFLVKEHGDSLQVAVINGSVDVRLRKNEGPHVELNAGQQVAITGDRLSQPTPANPELLTAWLRRRLIFDGTPLTEVVDELNRYHAGRIMILGTGVGRIQVSGFYHLSDIATIVDTLAQTLPIRKIQITHRLILLY
jgi:transmembrane sensor